MKAVILAGGFGTRISEESSIRPKPMIEIGNHPILWHIMKHYYQHGVRDFIICCGYRGQMIKEFFASYTLEASDVTFDFQNDTVEYHRKGAETWRITCVETGESTLTGGRLKRVRDFIGDETFLMTYGDGVSDINIRELVQFHKDSGTKATLTAVQPAGRFGAFSLRADQMKVEGFREKPKGDSAWVNGGFFVLEPEVFDYIEGDTTTWEREPLERLSQEGELSAFRHEGFWQPMDTLRDKNLLEELWKSGNPPWKSWA